MTGKEFAMEKEKSSARRHAGRGNLPPSESEIEGILKSPPASGAPKDKRVVEDESGAGAKAEVSRKVKTARGASEVKTEEKERLPASVMSAFPDADLKDVVVIRNSKKAREAGVSAFTEGNVIHVAPGEFTDETLRHEVAHYVQQKKGKEEGVSDDKDREKEAEEAERSHKVSSASLGPASPGKRQNKTKKGSYRKTSRKQSESIDELPTAEISFQGGRLKIDSISGSHTFKSTGIYWPGKQKGGGGGNNSDIWWKLFHVHRFWPIPAFPAAGVSVDLDAGVRAGLEVSGLIEYSVSRDEESNQWVATLSGKSKLSAFAEVSATLTGGVELNVVVQRGGAGVFASGLAEVKAETEAGVEGEFNLSTKKGSLKAVGDIELGGDLKGSLGVAVWVRGWFADKYRKWTLAEFPFAYFRGAKGQLAVQLLGPGGVKVDTMGWGRPIVGLGKAPDLK